MTGKWVLTFEAPVGERVMRYFHSCTTFDDLWFCEERNKFVAGDDIAGRLVSSASPRIRTVKSFIRFLRKHGELKGHEVVLRNNFVGYNVKANWLET